MATFKYDGAHRRNAKSIVDSGVELTQGDGGNATENYYRSGSRVIQIGRPPWKRDMNPKHAWDYGHRT